MATQTSTRTTTLGIEVEFEYTPDATTPITANKGIVTIIALNPDNTNGNAKQVTISYGAAAGDNNAQTTTIKLDNSDILSLFGVTSMPTNKDILFHLNTIGSDNNSIISGAAGSVNMDPIVAPVLSVQSFEGLDNKVRITVANTNPSTYSPMETDADKFEIFYKSHNTDLAGQSNVMGTLSVASAVQATDADNAPIANTYVLTSVVDTAVLANDQVVEVWARGQVAADKGGHLTDLNNVDGTEIVPNNRPAAPTDLVVNTNLATTDGSNSVPSDDYPVKFSGTWADNDTSTDNLSYKYGRLDSDGAFMDDYSTETETALSGTWEFDIPNSWFLADVSNNLITLGIQVTQQGENNAALARSSVMSSTIVAAQPTLPTIALSSNPTVNAGGDQTFTVTATGIHLTDQFSITGQTCPLTAQYQNGNNGTWTDITLSTTTTDETQNTVGTQTGTFTLDYDDITTDQILQVRVKQNDPNNTQLDGSLLEYIREGDDTFTLYQYKNPTMPAISVADSASAGLAPVVTQGAATLNGWEFSSSELEVFGNTIYNTNSNSNTWFKVHGSTPSENALLSANGGVTATANGEGQNDHYNPGKNIKATLKTTFSFPTKTGYTTPANIELTENSGNTYADFALYYENPEITGITVSGTIMTINGNTNGASFDAGAVTAFALTNHNSTGDHFTKLSANVSAPNEANQILGNFNFSSELNMNASIITDQGFRGLAHLDANNANSHLLLIQ